MEEDRDWVREWAMLKAGQDEVWDQHYKNLEAYLRSKGHTRSSFKDVEQKALVRLGEATATTEWGLVHKIETPVIISKKIAEGLPTIQLQLIKP